MADDTRARDHIGECARHQNRDGASVDVYDGLSEEDRLALARMLTDRERPDTRRWANPPEEL
jgi:hypothetical protein